MTGVRIGVIGAGSAVFSWRLVQDLCLTEALCGSEIVFMDIDASRLGWITRLAQRYVDELSVDLRFSATQDREVALRDADYVINTALDQGHGPHEAWRGQSEALGYYRGHRLPTYLCQFDLMLSVARDMERICPDAWLLQSSNPVYEGCNVMTRLTGAKVVGLCHGFGGLREICRALSVPFADCEWQAVGVNHWIYLTQFRYQGRDLYPALDTWIEEQGPDYWRTFDGSFGNTQLSRAACDHYRRVGLMPVGDASRTFSEWYYHSDLATKQAWYGHLGGFDSELGWGRYLEGLNQRIATIRDTALDNSVPVSEKFPPQLSGELHADVMDAISNDNPKILQVNVPNNGCIAGVADDVVIEGKALVSQAGIQLLQLGQLPAKFMEMVLKPRIAKADKWIAAYTSGDRDLLVSCVLDDHRTRSLAQAEELVDAMLALPWLAHVAQRYGPPRAVLGGYRLP